MPKCNVRRKAQLGLDIREGGIAIPIAPNMYYMDGRSHNEGGIGIGPNNKNGLEVEGGEVVKVGKNDVKVFSSVPLLRGVSPAQLVMGGANPDTVFKAQEEFKDRNRINDDGTRYQTGGQKKSNSAIRTEADKKVPAYSRAVYSLVDPTMAYPTKKEAFGYAIGAGIKAMRNPNDMVYWVTDSVSDAAWRKRHGLSYDNKFLIPNEDGSVRLPKDREMEIPTDTTMLKNRIAANKKLAKRYPEGSEKRDIVDWALRVDGMALDSLRHTYRTGELVTINEGAYNSRRLINNGELSYPEIMPHNVMQNYAIQYDKSKDKMNYWDTYDFNEFEWGVPGKPFEIKGSIPLKKAGGIYNKFNNIGNRSKKELGGDETIGEIKTNYFTGIGKFLNPIVDKFANNYAKDVFGDLPINEIRKRLYNNLTPASYSSPLRRIEDAVKHNKPDGLYEDWARKYRDDIFATYLDIPVNERHKNAIYYRVIDSNYKPTKGNNNKEYKTVDYLKDIYDSRLIKAANNIPIGKNRNSILLNKFFGEHTLGKGVDKNKGQYVSFYDKWDIAPFLDKEDETLGIGKPIEFYDRIYFDDYYKVNSAPNKGDYYGGYLPEIKIKANKKEFGGSMLYTINGNVKNGLMSARPKAQYGTITRHGKIWKWDEENGAYIPVKDSKEKELINVNKQTNSSTSSNKKPNYTINGTFDNARPQYYAEKRLPIAGSQSIAEKVGLARSGWSYGENPTFDYMPNINLTVPENYSKGVASSTPRGRGTKVSTTKAASQSTPAIQDTVNKITMDAWKASKTPKIDLTKVKMPTYNVSDLGSKETKTVKAKLNTSPTGGIKEAPWVPQYNLINGRDWLGVGTNLAGHIASYFANNSLLKKAPMPIKPVQFQAAKLKTTHNINPELANINEVTQMNLAEVGRNTASSNTSIARKQRIMNEARDARNKLYGQKENIETQLINLDRRNRQDVYNRNIAAYNDWLDKTYVAKSNNLLNKQRNLTNLISGIPMAVNTMLGTIESRKSTNDMIQAISSSRSNVDGRLLGIGDYYSQKLPDGRTAIYNKNHKLVKYV